LHAANLPISDKFGKMVSLDFTPFFFNNQIKMGKNFQQAVILFVLRRNKPKRKAF
jgi:hypothetical protein